MPGALRVRLSAGLRKKRERRMEKNNRTSNLKQKSKK
jgi:hypothetical protein